MSQDENDDDENERASYNTLLVTKNLIYFGLFMNFVLFFFG